MPTQLEKAPTLIFASRTFSRPLIMVAAFPMRRVCLMIEYGIILWTPSTSFRRYGPSGDRTKTWWMKVARLECQIISLAHFTTTNSLDDDVVSGCLHRGRVFLEVRLLGRDIEELIDEVAVHQRMHAILPSAYEIAGI